jgi:hypothetical protein
VFHLVKLLIPEINQEILVMNQEENSINYEI